MADRTLTFAFSPCPNDTFAFHALVHGLVPGVSVQPQLDDIEALNLRAERGEADITKVSMAAVGRVRQHYVLLRAGGAAGFGVGPIVVARTSRPVGGRIAIPGERTTAALLLRLVGHFETVPMRFDRIEDAAKVVLCKSHHMAQAVLTYEAAYLKAHHPHEFHEALQQVSQGATADH